MPLRSCTYPQCARAAERAFGNCMICSEHYCAGHCGSKFHKCPKEDDDADSFFTAFNSARSSRLQRHLARINVDSLAVAASEANGSISCTVPALARDVNGDVDLALIATQMAGQNAHVDIKFEDGTIWLARIRLEDPILPPKATQHYIFMSEIATLRFLEEINVPAPKVYAYAAESKDNHVGTSYILMEKLAGVPVHWWETTAAQRKKLITQLADIYIELERHPFPLIGSLSMNGPAVKVGGFAQSGQSSLRTCRHLLTFCISRASPHCTILCLLPPCLPYQASAPCCAQLFVLAAISAHFVRIFGLCKGHWRDWRRISIVHRQDFGETYWQIHGSGKLRTETVVDAARYAFERDRASREVVRGSRCQLDFG